MNTPARIRLLTPELANQIAAGEVVERPASVLKELLENAIDAHARFISIELVDAGIEYIRVRDDGIGILKEDLVYAVTRHATSKIASFSDLMHLRTLGFRGEALASIASVSQLTLSSCVEGAACGYRVHVENPNNEPLLTPTAHPIGTSVEVRSLFYNTPARRKFLKGLRTELYYVQEVIAKMALSHPEISFQVVHQQKKLAQWAGVDILRWQERIAQILGKSFLEHGVYFEAKLEDLAVWGWLIPPSASGRQKEQQYTFVNTRAVRDKVINHAVKAAWLTAEGQDTAIQIVLFLQVDPTHIDVNVHPTKHEVRFHQPSLVHDVIEGTLRDCLARSRGETPDLWDEEASPPIELPSWKSIHVRSHPVHAQMRIGPYCMFPRSQDLWVLDLPQVAAWWIQENFTQGRVQTEKLLFPEICTVENLVLEQLESAFGQALCAALKITGRSIGAKQWLVEYFPDLLSGCDIQALMKPVFTVLLQKGTSSACIAEWASIASSQLFNTTPQETLDNIVDHLLRLPLAEQRSFMRVLEAKHLEKLFVV